MVSDSLAASASVSIRNQVLPSSASQTYLMFPPGQVRQKSASRGTSFERAKSGHRVESTPCESRTKDHRPLPNLPLVFHRNLRKLPGRCPVIYQELAKILAFLQMMASGTNNEAGRRHHLFKEPDMLSASTATLARFAVLPSAAAAMPQRRSGLAGFFLAPFRDVD